MPATPNRPSPSLDLVDGRRAHRYLMGGPLTCTAGKVVNLSALGALVVCRSPHVAESIPFQLSDGTNTFGCRAKVIRTTALGPSRFETAVEFMGMTNQDRATLDLLCRRYRLTNGRQARGQAA